MTKTTIKPLRNMYADNQLLTENQTAEVEDTTAVLLISHGWAVATDGKPKKSGKNKAAATPPESDPPENGEHDKQDEPPAGSDSLNESEPSGGEGENGV